MSIEFWAAHKTNPDGTKSTEYDYNFYLSNFFAAPITAWMFGQEIKFRTSEHFYQAMKFEYVEKNFFQVVNAKTPREAADLGRTLSGMRPDWDEVKDGVMFDVLMKKFEQNPKLREELIATGDEELIEASSKDGYWGWGKDHNGKNMLGKTLMMVREKLK
jgi:ribA/ribD-fused uncharacterized protein